MLFKSKRSRRYKTLLLGMFALLALIFGLIYLLDVPAQEAFALLGASVIMVFFIALAGFIFVALLFLCKWLFKRFKQPSINQDK